MAADHATLGASLDAVVNFDSVVCLNEASDHPVANLFFDETNELSSDADQQLLLHIPFVEPVHLAGLRLVASGEEAPASVKLFLNQPNFGFDDAESEAAAHQFSPHFEDTHEALVTLPPTKFRSVHTLTLFVEDNFGADVTKICRLEFYGSLALGGTPGSQHSGSSRQQRKAAFGSKNGAGGVIQAAEVASRLGSQSSEDGLSRVLLEVVSKVGHGQGRNLVRRATKVHLAAATGEGDRRRRALLAVGTAARLLGGPVEHNDGAWRGMRLAAGHGLMAALETSAHEQLWTLQELMARGLPAGAILQLLRAGARDPPTSDEAALRTLLQSLCSAEGARPRDVLLAGQWIADGLQDPEGGLQELCRAMAADFATQLGNRGASTETRDRPGWCAAAADALSWLPPSLHNDGLLAMAAQAPKAAPRRGKDPTSADAQRDSWSVDLHSLPTYQLPCCVSVKLVDTKQALQTATSQLFAEASTVGVDAEWGNDSDLSLVQLATENACFLVDVGAIAMDPTLKAGLAEVLETAFSRPVVAWSFREDARRLARLHGPLEELLPLVYDLQPPVRRRLGLPQPPSLQRACAELLGAAMDKTQQRSAWDQRPLSEAQKHYAACDAHVLLDLAQKLREDEEEDEQACQK